MPAEFSERHYSPQSMPLSRNDSGSQNQHGNPIIDIEVGNVRHPKTFSTPLAARSGSCSGIPVSAPFQNMNSTARRWQKANEVKQASIIVYDAAVSASHLSWKVIVWMRLSGGAVANIDNARLMSKPYLECASTEVRLGNCARSMKFGACAFVSLNKPSN
jgi:hypothetical protein